MEKQALLNTYINNVTMPETIAAIEKMIADNTFTMRMNPSTLAERLCCHQSI